MARPSRRQAAAATAVQQAASINAFLKVSKTMLATKELAAKKEIGLDTVPTTNVLLPQNSRKRRAEDDLDDESVQISMVLPTRAKARLPKRSCRPEDHAVVAGKENISAQTKPKAPTVSEAQKLHHKSAAKSVIDKAKARTTSRPKKSVHELLVEKHAASAQRTAARATKSASQQLPAEFAELIELHRAFLKAVVLKHAHGGSNVPLPLAELLPHVTQAWGRRAVTVEDVRRCVAVEDLAGKRRRESQGQEQGQGQDASGSGSPFVICDYGRGRVCLEVADDHAGAPVNEKRLCREFERSLVWLRAQRDAERATENGTSTTATDTSMELDIPLEALSLADLPQAPIAARASLFPANPLLARGQRALAELKNGIAERRLLEKASAAAAAAKSKSADDALAVDMGPTSNEATTVLDRIRAKQQARAAGPPPPSAAELERRAALQRAVDVAAVVRAYTRATGRGLPRVAVPMPTLLQRLRDSLRVPLSGDEGVAVVRLLAREVAPEWLKIVVVGGRETVVVQTGAEPSERLVAERAERFA